MLKVINYVDVVPLQYSAHSCISFHQSCSESDSASVKSHPKSFPLNGTLSMATLLMIRLLAKFPPFAGVQQSMLSDVSFKKLVRGAFDV